MASVASLPSLFAAEDSTLFKQIKMKGVKALVDSGITQIPDFYIKPVEDRALEERPLVDDQVPVIDFSGIYDPVSRSRVVKAIGDACKEWGVFQVINHGVPKHVLQDMIEVGHEFFNLPLEDKMSYYSDDLSQPVRFGTSYNPAKETILEWRDVLRHPGSISPEAVQLWPEKPESYRENTTNYLKGAKVFAETLFAALSESLGVQSDYLQNILTEMMFGINYYPYCPNPDLTLGLSAHSDASGITILLQDQIAGLQVLREGRWYLVQPRSDAFVINVGDQLEILSNGRFKSVEHRVTVNKEKTRISIGILCVPLGDTRIAPISGLIDESHPPMYREVIFKEYLGHYFSKQHNRKSSIDSVRLKF
ncbi:hypothetical protein O6H91_08G017900 [Diphasiastrum complanatum]|uniref:Uncharacterized protein n=1 Tax=Diphasiastrum complanatum TaxID=34168 RepID=A0ACC2CVC4_DIPCM|nr:hypothetical protein O6H91_08G017900 [Diphasiastrum complanatum]